MLWGNCIYDVWCFGQSEVIRAILFEDSPCCGVAAYMMCGVLDSPR